MKYLILLLFSSFAFSIGIPELTGPVVDLAGLLNSDSKIKIDSALRNYKAKYGVQMQVLIIDSLDGESIEAYSIKVLDQWKLGKKGEDKGLLFLISIKDRLMRIEVGRGLEGVVTDASAGRVIDLVRPYFKEKSYGEGIVVGLRAIASLCGGELDSLPKRTNNMGGKLGTFRNYIIFAIFLIPWFLINSSRSRSRGRSTVVDCHSGYSSSNIRSHRSSSSGRSSWSGGGGGFSGGGSSGGW